MFICLACEPDHELGYGYTRRFAANTRRNRPRQNFAAPTWPLNSCATTCAGAVPARPASRSGCLTCPSKQNAECAREKTAEDVEAG